MGVKRCASLRDKRFDELPLGVESSQFVRFGPARRAHIADPKSIAIALCGIYARGRGATVITPDADTFVCHYCVRRATEVSECQ